jgi:hypothetical protein
MMIPERVKDRVFRHVEPVRTDRGCLISRYSVGSHGYAQVGWVEGGITRMALCHRVAWQSVNGEIPEKMTVDHVCKTRRCVEVTHLRLLSNFENARRTSGRDWPLGQCINGHAHEKFWRKPTPKSKGYCHACRMKIQARRRAAGHKS